MKFAILQHENSTPAGSTLEWLKNHKFQYQIYSPLSYTEFQLPDVNDFDHLIICGGSMNVDQEDKFLWLKNEKALIKKTLLENKKILGLCLGAQLIAEVLEAKVYRQNETELGWHKIQFTNSTENELMVFQYHSYTFELPREAQLLATNTACKNQAFQFKNQVLAFQFHPETTVEWANQCADGTKLPLGQYCQDKATIKSLTSKYQTELQRWYFEKLNHFFKV